MAMVTTPTLDEDLSLEESVEDLGIEQCVAWDRGKEPLQPYQEQPIEGPNSRRPPNHLAQHVRLLPQGQCFQPQATPST